MTTLATETPVRFIEETEETRGIRDFAFERDADVFERDRILEGYVAVFNQETRIRNAWEGDFTEVVRKGAFAKAVRANPRPKVMFEHGKHPQIANMPIAELLNMREDDHGLYVRAKMYENGLTAALIQAIDGGSIEDMSFRFIVPEGGDEWSPDRERRELVRDLEVPEFGPVVWGAYPGTSISMRARNIAASYQDDDIAHDWSMSFLLNPDTLADPSDDEARADEPPAEPVEEVRTEEKDADQTEVSSAPNPARVHALTLEARLSRVLQRSIIEPPELPVD